MNIGEFAAAIAVYGLLMDASATSWGRTREHNAAVGGVGTSAHRFWLGVDVVYDHGLPQLEGARAYAERLGLKLIREVDHDHLQPLDWKAD